MKRVLSEEAITALLTLVACPDTDAVPAPALAELFDFRMVKETAEGGYYVTGAGRVAVALGERRPHAAL